MKLEGLADKVAVVTGAAGVLGRAVADRLWSEGARVVAVDIDRAGLERHFGDRRERLECVDANLVEEAEVEALVRAVLSTQGGVDFLVNVAGGELKPSRAYPDVVESRGMHPIESIDWLTFQRTLAINLTSAFLCCRAFVPHLKARGSGRIINFASFATRHGSIHVGAHYAAAKGGIIGLTKTLALELAPYQITVNAIAPGLIPHGPIRSPALQATVDRIPLGRVGTPEDIASVVAVLCSTAGSYTTGITLDVNGGLYLAP
ncbi:MAG: SDR family oxidoreductase [Firmicutes bacterium]|nr:SDR family oxidoreductase [Alicyclobacillaceae bacterium]MCL6498178.1 SDR family oxidoreductase [Bacillota bacterium]